MHLSVCHQLRPGTPARENKKRQHAAAEGRKRKPTLLQFGVHECEKRWQWLRANGWAPRRHQLHVRLRLLSEGTPGCERTAVAAAATGAAARRGTYAVANNGHCSIPGGRHLPTQRGSLRLHGRRRVPIPARIEAILAGATASVTWFDADEGDSSEHDDTYGQCQTEEDTVSSPRTTPTRRLPTATSTSTAAARDSLRDAAGRGVRQPARRRVSFDLRDNGDGNKTNRPRSTPTVATTTAPTTRRRRTSAAITWTSSSERPRSVVTMGPIPEGPGRGGGGEHEGEEGGRSAARSGQRAARGRGGRVP
ncbi:unnamed protein product, partial [Prorocentrum cordatum]